VSELLDASYARCRAINRAHGTTYYWAAQLLPGEKRRSVHAVYAFCRYADDIVDDLGDVPQEARADALRRFGESFFSELAAGSSDDPVLAAVVDTVDRWSIPEDAFRRFLRAMTADLTVSRYETWDDLLEYMDGSAAVIGEMMLPILEPVSVEAVRPARDLGFAFQLTNFLRDVDEDLDRGRVYLPQEDLERFGADPAARRVDGAWRELMAFEIERARALYRSADRGIPMLRGRAARCIAAARVLYSGILDEIEAAGYDVFSGRVRVPTRRKVLTAARLFVGPMRRVQAAGRPLLATGTRNP
jgi:phytoene synthase